MTTATKARRVFTSEYSVNKAFVFFYPDDNEYQVELFVRGVKQEDATYFTDDKEDAKGTARLMTGELKTSY